VARLHRIRRFGDFAHLTLSAPAVARGARPGQFLEIRTGGGPAPFWRRPFSICRATATQVEVLVKAVGPGSRWLAARRVGETLDLLGPLGRGYSLAGREPRLLVGGGYGVAPLLFLAERLRARGCAVEALVGGRCTEDLLLRNELRRAGARVACATEDGGTGMRGTAADLLSERLRGRGRPVRIAACGPRGLLAAVARLARRYGLPAEVSLEETLACGLGVCNGCVVRVKGEYRRVCVDGPVFPAEDVEWHEEE